MGRHAATTTKKIAGTITTASGLPHTTSSTRWRRMLSAALCAAALGAALTVPAIASAGPKYDADFIDICATSVIDNLDEGLITGAEADNALRECCIDGGGVPNGLRCDPPPAEPAQVRPGLIPPGGLPTLTPAPASPSPGVMPTLTAVPGTRG